MYPYLRAIHTYTKKYPPLASIWDPVITDMRVWPGDIDIFMEVNNGRYLTLMDFGRFEYFRRLEHMKVNPDIDTKWGGAVAGASVRYRKRLHLFNKIKQSTQLVALDERWWYFGQTIEQQEAIHVSALIRFAVTDQNGLVATKRIEEVYGVELERRMPDWVSTWDESDQMRPWVSMAEPAETNT